jgi:hypothetical protein
MYNHSAFKSLTYAKIPQLTDTRKKEILSFLGFLSSRRKTSLTVKPGKSAADFLKRRQSYESQEVEEGCSTSSGDGSEALGEVFEDVFEQNESILTPNSSTDSFRNKSLSNTGIVCCKLVRDNIRNCHI